MSNRLDEFLQAVRESFPEQDPKVYWPLNGGQVDAYFDVAEAFDVYERVSELKKTYSIKEISKILPNADILRSFLLNNGILGLKIARMKDIEPITNEEIVEYLETIFDVMKEHVKNDIFCRDGKNMVMSQKEVDGLGFDWEQADENNKRQISNLVVTGTHYCYSLFYDLFKSTGFRLHGKYDVSKKFGKGAVLIVREYYNLNPSIWKVNFPHKTFTMYTVYKDLDFKLDLLNHPHSNTGIGNKLIAYKVLIDGKEVGLNEIRSLEEMLEKKTIEQTALVEAFDDFDKIRKGAEISTYAFAELRKNTSQDFQVLEWTDKNITDFGRKFLDEFDYKKEIPNIDHWVELFDPRNDVM